MIDISKIKARYNKGYSRIDQLKRYVELEVITPEQYADVCGQSYKNSQQETLREEVEEAEPSEIEPQ